MKVGINSEKSDKHGFTLMEIIVIIVILSGLVILLIPKFLIQAERSRVQEAVLTFPLIYQGQKEFYREHGQYATKMNDLDVSIGAFNGFKAIELENAVTMVTDDGNLSRIAKVARTDEEDSDLYYLYLEDSEGAVYCKDAIGESYCEKLGIPASSTDY